MEELRRTFSDPFSLDQAVTLERLTDIIASEGLSASLGAAFWPIQDALTGWHQLRVSGEAERLVLNGQIPHSLTPTIFQLAINLKLTRGLCILSENSGQLLALATPSVGGVGVKISRVFPRVSTR